MYYVLEFSQDSERHNDEKSAKQLIDSYNDIDKSVTSTKTGYDFYVWWYVLGSEKISKLEKVVEDIFKKEGYDKVCSFGVKIEAFPYDKKIVLSSDRYKHRSFY